MDCVGRQGWIGGMGVDVKGESKKTKVVDKMPCFCKIIRVQGRKRIEDAREDSHQVILGWWDLRLSLVLKYFHAFKFLIVNT